MMTGSKDKKEMIIAVTGANRGIGAAIAVELAGRGYTVACLTRQGIAPKTPEAEGVATSSRLFGIRCDVTDPASIQAAVGDIVAMPGRLWGLVNCAGIIKGGPSQSFTVADFEATMKTNVVGAFSMCQAVYQPLADQGGGLIINIGSFWDQMGVKWYAAYCASKAAVGALTRCLGVEWGKKGIRVVTVAPGYIETEMTAKDLQSETTRKFLESRLPLGRVGQPREVAAVIAALFDADVGYLTATTIYVDGGQGAAM